MSALVSTIIPVFNRPKMLQEAVQSVLSQTYRPIEIIIVDDHSNDETVQTAQKLAQQHDEVTCLLSIGKGPGMARETGRLQAQGDYIQYLDSDDLLLPEKFAQQIKQFNQTPNAQICYGKEVRRDAEYLFDSYAEFQTNKPIKSTGRDMTHIFPHILYDSLWGTSVPLWRKNLTDALGSWLPLINEEDIEYDARAGASQALLTRVDDFVAIQRIHDNHLSSGGIEIPEKLSHRVKARKKILEHALNSGLLAGSDSLVFFSKSTFLLARQCAKQGMDDEFEDALQIAQQAMGKITPLMKYYKTSVKFVGPKITQSCITFLERFRR